MGFDVLLASLLPVKSWTPFGVLAPYTGGGVDTTISANTTIASPYQTYGNLTINAGIVLSTQVKQQVIVCKTLTFGSATSQISADGQGALGGVLAGNLYAAGAITPGTAPSAYSNGGSSNDTYGGMFYACFAAGGAGGNGTPSFLGSPGGSADARALSALFMLMRDPAVPLVGGGGGCGSNAGGTNTAPNYWAYAGLGPPRNYGQTGGGSGIGGGGGGGWGGGGGTAPSGGNGGGCLVILCDDIQGSAGIISANGSAGATQLQSGGGNSGGGGGGLVVVYTRALTVSPTLRSQGGAAGSPGAVTGTNAGAAGGNGYTILTRAL